MKTVKLPFTDYKGKEIEVGGWKMSLRMGKKDALFPKQVHGGNIVEASHLKNKGVEADGVMLDNFTGVAVGVVTADCAPVVVTTKERAVVLHISRKTLIRGVLDSLEKYIRAEDIQNVYIGPHICERHFSFETEGKEIREFMQKYPEAVERRDGRVYLSIRKALQLFFNKWGVSIDKIIEDGRCTYESEELPSYERWRQEKRKEELECIQTVIRKVT